MSLRGITAALPKSQAVNTAQIRGTTLSGISENFTQFSNSILWADIYSQMSAV